MATSTGFDFDAAVAAPFRMQPGLRRVAPSSRPLSDLAPDSAAFAEKLAVLLQAPHEALLCAEGFDPLPMLKRFAAQASASGAPGLVADVDGVVATTIGWRVSWGGALSPAVPDAHAAAGQCIAALRPHRRLAGLLSLALHEDLAIVDGARATLPWMAVCLPSHWAPAEKIGRSFATVHAPVADNATLLAAAEHLSRLVCQAQRWERFVWNITPHAGYDQHPMRHARATWPATAEELIARSHWRTEHQSFIPLPELKQAVFTIHVAVQPLVQAIDTPARASALHAALATMSDAVLAYRHLGEARAPLLAWLASRAFATQGN